MWAALMEALRQLERRLQGRQADPSAGSIDSQSIKAAKQNGEIGFDGGKQVKGRKRHLLVDTLGLIVAVVVTSANTDDRVGLMKLLNHYFAHGVARLRKVWVDQGYRAQWLRTWVWGLKKTHKIDLEVTENQGKGFHVIPWRWAVEIKLQWLIEGEPFDLRLIVRWNAETKCFESLLTNLPQTRYSLDLVCLGQRLRWRVELLFKEWKSHTNLHKFDTEKETTSEALIWASLAASALKRFLAHCAERLLEVAISTRKTSMPSAYELPQLFRTLREGDGPVYRRAFKAMIRYLGTNDKRAHPERDARTGRARLGLKPLFQLSEPSTVIETLEEPMAA